MIKAAITGGDTPAGGEVIRLLTLHPEVVLTEVSGNSKVKGMKLSDLHHGLIGETDLCFVERIDAEKADVLFMCDEGLALSDMEAVKQRWPDLKLIVLKAREQESTDDDSLVYGISEINRKAFVRGTTVALLPHPFTTMATIALFPFAKNLLLNGSISIDVSAPEAIVDSTDAETVKKEINKVLSRIQNSFKDDIAINVKKTNSRRTALMTIEFDCQLDLEHILNVYEIYDDHNFTFLSSVAPGVSEVAGTDKIIISPEVTDNGKARLTIAADCRLRGSAGDAVHVMNLMFGLHEKTGLALKAADFEPVKLI